ncbi:uncharacterized protein J4E87_009812 [Alternaria ethzedia]|uniref:uncharacterized protein n=1 Tax=Alternaria ethzedia TaxID=181014 RepID=UPI0020C1F06A|nr:uncharacterized protein J4E87_009812 [Alternaria ethzedia]KAI4613511.1 hypothetical protein J4E87_009812 [Alternaria ethzedia]
MKNLTNPELEHLELSRKMSDPGPFSDQEQEDAFALRMLHLGARWWPSLKFYERHTRDGIYPYGSISYPYGHHFPSDLHVAYTPNGSGLWVLAVWAENSQSWLEEYDPPRKPEDWVDLAYCRTMEERCKILEEFGATFYEDVEQCDKLPWNLDEGVREGKKYEGLLRKMEDDKYLDDWMMSL